jgi:hypothetical protein
MGFFGLNTYVCRKEICIAKSSVQKGYSNNHIFEMWSSLPSVLSAPRVSTAGEGLMCNKRSSLTTQTTLEGVPRRTRGDEATGK